MKSERAKTARYGTYPRNVSEPAGFPDGQVFAPPTSEAGRVAKTRRMLARWGLAYLFIAPSVIMFVVVFAYPIVFSVRLGFYEWS